MAMTKAKSTVIASLRSNPGEQVNVINYSTRLTPGLLHPAVVYLLAWIAASQTTAPRNDGATDN